MITLGVNSSNDIFIGNDGNLTLYSSADACQQCCETAVKMQLGEAIYDTSSGMPTLATAWDEYNPQQFEAAARTIISGVSGVISVTQFSVSRIKNTLSYAATIQTIYGTAVING